MTRARLFWFSLVVAAILALPGWTPLRRVLAADWRIEGRVVAVSDGHTILLLDHANAHHNIRLLGIHAPEKGQAFSERSKESLAQLALDRRVMARCHKRDRYLRELCKVSVGPTDVNLEQIRAGMAWWYRAYAPGQPAADRLIYESVEQEARAKGIGLWNDAWPIPPWEWQTNGRERAASLSPR
jgi:endonuclease YncB( thermonuclease family)